MRKLLIVADYNDADYSKDVIKIEDDVFEKFRPMLDAINNFKPYVCRYWCGGIAEHNWESSREDLVTDELYVDYDPWEIENRYDSKVKGYLNEESEITSYRRPSDGKPLNSIPYSEMTKEENELIEKLHSLWKKYQ